MIIETDINNYRTDGKADEAEKIVQQTRLKGDCCSQTLISMCHKGSIGIDQKDFIDAVTAFSNQIGKGKICGTLAAAIAALYISDYDSALFSDQDEYMDWFATRFGGFDCDEIVKNDPKKRIELCPKIVLESFVKLHEYIKLTACMPHNT